MCAITETTDKTAAAVTDSPAPAIAPTQKTVSGDAVVAGRRFRQWAPDLVKAVAAVAVIVVAVALWFQPPLYQTDHPYISYLYGNKIFKDAKLYRPVAMPTRYYVELPHILADRYQWFAIDRRREVVAVAEAPKHRMAGQKAIRRSDPLGLDLEFRKLDRSEWQIHFFDDAIVFSNAVLCVRLDINEPNSL